MINDVCTDFYYVLPLSQIYYDFPVNLTKYFFTRFFQLKNSCFFCIPEAYRVNPRLVWEFYNYRREIVKNRQPNPGHYAVAKIQKILSENFQSNLRIITQNVDNLHRRAEADVFERGQNPNKILKLHGDLMSVRCHVCRNSFTCEDSPIDESFKKYQQFNEDLFSTDLSDIDIDSADSSTKLPKKNCPKCNSNQLVRPDIVWFGENLDSKILKEVSNLLLNKCDLMIIVGTSSAVYPAAGFAERFVESRLEKGLDVENLVFEVNLESEYIPGVDDERVVRINGKSGEILPKVHQNLLELVNDKEK